MPNRRTQNLHQGRHSVPGARYFLTLCTANRVPALGDRGVARAVRAAILAADAAGDSRTLAFIVMPDHVHWLLELGARLSLGRVVSKFKTQTRRVLNERKCIWQRDFFEHRLRAEESVEEYARYIFLNPYGIGQGDGVVARESWYSATPEFLRFPALLDADGSPPNEWLGERLQMKLCTGE